MPTRNFSVRFYTATVGPNEQHDSVASALRALVGLRHPFALQRGDNAYFIKDLGNWNQGRNFRGVFCKVRMSDIPHVGDAEGNESEIDLEPEEGLIEKNHFLFTANRDLLMYQENFYGCTTAMFGDYLTQYIGAATDFAPVIKPDTLRRFMRGDVALRQFDVSVARPTNANMFPANDFSRGMLQLMQTTDSATLSVHMSANGPGVRGNAFPQRVKQAIRQLVQQDLASKAKVWVEEDGIRVPLDLIADRLSVKRRVEMDGRYPRTDDMFTAIEEARREVAQELDDYFGQNGQAIA